MKIFEIDGYWVDDPDDEFSGYLVTEFDEVPNGWDDSLFFYHGLSEDNIKEAIKNKEAFNEDFVITDYSVLERDV